MRAISLGALFAVLLVLTSLQVSADNSKTKPVAGEADPRVRTFTEPLAAAQDSLNVLAKIQLPSESETELFARSLGFTSTDELPTAQLGNPLHFYEVPVGQLESFQKETDPATLLVDTHLLIFPLLAHGRARSTLTVAELTPDKGWRAVSRGRQKLVRLITQHRTSDTQFLVAITALGLQFLGDGIGNKMILTPLQDIVTLDAPAGQPIPAHKLFTLLSQDLKALREGSDKQKQMPTR